MNVTPIPVVIELAIVFILLCIVGPIYDNAHLWEEPIYIWCLIVGITYILGSLISMALVSLQATFMRIKVGLSLVLIGFVGIGIAPYLGEEHLPEVEPSADQLAANCDDAKWLIVTKYDKDNGRTAQIWRYIEGNTADMNERIASIPAAWKKDKAEKRVFVSVEKNLCYIPPRQAEKYAKEHNLTFSNCKRFSESVSLLRWQEGKAEEGKNDE